MTPLSIGKAWEETVVFVKREGQLLFPVAFLFLALPMAIWPHLLPPEWETWKPDGSGKLPPMPASMAIGFLAAMLCTTFGSLGLFSLALRPGISVAEALRLGAVRLPVLIGAAFLAFGAFIVAGLACLLVVGAIAVAFKPLAALVGFLLSVVALFGMVYVSVRLILLNPVVLDGSAGPVASIRAAWAMSKGHFWQLLGFLTLIMAVTIVATGAAQAVFGSIGGLIGGASAGLLVGGLASAIVSAVANVYMLVMMARIYRQAQPVDLGAVFD